MDQSAIDALRSLPIAPQAMWIAGKRVQARDGATFDAVSPIDGTVLTQVPSGSAADMQAAVAAARASFEAGAWSNMAPAARKTIMHRIADLIQKHALELAVLGVRDNGTEISMAIKAEPGSAAATFRFYAECVDKIMGDVAPTDPSVLGLIHREAVGVVGAIVPWNFPLMIAAWKIAPALAVGNSVVLKPAEVASLSLLRLVELCHEAGLPDGVLNVVTGSGSVVGAALAESMEVDVLTFTGSGATGRRLLQASAASNLKPCYLELGGKSPNIIFDDAPNLDKAIAVAAAGIFRNSGQVCVAGSRLLVQASIYDEVVEKLSRQAASMRVGDPLDMATEAGAVSSAVQLAQNLEHVEAAVAQGARLATGGARILDETGGFYMQPTVFADVHSDMRLAQDEVFGPVLGVMRFEDEAEAVALANQSIYGLAAGVWTSDLGRAHRMVKAIKAGVVHVNTYGGPDITVPLSGHKQSGNGSDKSIYALEKFSKLKTAWIQL
jgi:gamma-glutamyl-gamma-aminobutyraldehyde dehydrogenase